VPNARDATMTAVQVIWRMSPSPDCSPGEKMPLWPPGSHQHNQSESQFVLHCKQQEKLQWFCSL
jgi:hypothetical protein